MPDDDWLKVGVHRCLGDNVSGRGFLQDFSAQLPELCPEHANFFETCRSKRRLALIKEVGFTVRENALKVLPDRLKQFDCLKGFDIFAGDGHSIAHSCHDKRINGKVYAVSHFYARNLRNGLMHHLSIGDQEERKKEHDMRALKRTELASLKQGAPVGQKVLYVWDRAGIDFMQWFKWKQGSGIYMISRTKTNMELTMMGPLPWDRSDAINAGVIEDVLVGAGQTTLRRVTYHDAVNDRTFEFLTSLTDVSVPPGVIALLYRMRWGIEKSFDEMKNKLIERKAWASTPEAKCTQAEFICLTINLLLLLNQKLAKEEAITYQAEEKRREHRLKEAAKREKAKGYAQPSAWQRVQQPTQMSVKFYRWVATRVFKSDSWESGCEALRAFYARI